MNLREEKVATVEVENKGSKSGQVMIQTRDGDATAPEDYKHVKTILKF
jgi:hypothetical protein